MNKIYTCKHFQNICCMCVYLYIHNKYTQYTHILCKQKLLFWMRLFAINSLTPLHLILLLVHLLHWKWKVEHIALWETVFLEIYSTVY